MRTQTFLIRCEYPDGDHIPTQEFVENIQEYFAANIMDGERGRLVVKPVYQPKEEGLAEEGTKSEPKFKSGYIVKCSDNSVGAILDCEWSESAKSYQYLIDYIGTIDIGYQFEKDLQLHSVTIMDGRVIFENAKWEHEFECPEGYQFVDENGNVINATKIVLEKKKKEYPKTYEECYRILDMSREYHTNIGYKWELINNFQKLLICRDAYWKIAGEEMGLGKPWEPDYRYRDEHYSIYYNGFSIIQCNSFEAHTFIFPTAEMRDAFKENFDKDLEFCKELL